MKKILLFGIGAVATLAVVGAGYAIKDNQPATIGSGVQQKAANFVADFSGNVTRRIYFSNSGYNGEWYGGNLLYVYAETTSKTANSGYVQAVSIYNRWKTSHDNDLCYVDVTFAGAAGEINVKFSNDAVGSVLTESCTLPALSDKAADFIFIDNAYVGSKRAPAVTYAEMSTGVLACVLDHIPSCTATANNFANSYYAYPQLKANFIDVCSELGEWGDSTHMHGDDAAYTLNQKINTLSAMFTKNGWVVA